MSKVDGVIDAVRFKAGKIELVRAYERRGATYSDYVLLDRKKLIERLKDGKNFVTGQRIQYMASTFSAGKPVNLVGIDDKQVLTTNTQQEHDELEGVPAF
jgi:hypothetical protein